MIFNMYGWNNINSLLKHPLENNIDKVSIQENQTNPREGRERPSICIAFMVSEWELFEGNVRFLVEEITNKQKDINTGR